MPPVFYFLEEKGVYSMGCKCWCGDGYRYPHMDKRGQNHSLFCLVNPNWLHFSAEELALWQWSFAPACGPLGIRKIFPRWVTKPSLSKELIRLGILGLLSAMHFHRKIYQGQQQKTTVPHPKKWSWGNGFKAPWKCPKVWSPRGKYLWISRQKTKRSNPVLSPLNFPHLRLTCRKQNTKKSQEKPSSLGSPKTKDFILKLLVVPLCLFPWLTGDFTLTATKRAPRTRTTAQLPVTFLSFDMF